MRVAKQHILRIYAMAFIVGPRHSARADAMAMSDPIRSVRFEVPVITSSGLW